MRERRFIVILFLVLMLLVSVTSRFNGSEASNPVLSDAPRAESPNLVSTTLVINEIDYDQVNADTAEYMEIKNVSGGAIDLSAYTVLFINGTGGGAATYDTIALPAVNLAAGDYFVICANIATVPNCDLDDAPNTDFIQNGAPDAVAIMQSSTVIDTVSYEGNTGAPYTEGTGTSAADSNATANVGLSRFPDGTDTDVNNTDVTLRCITPGETNSAATSSCPTPPASIVPVCPSNITTLAGIPASASVSASDADSITNGVSITSITPSDPGTISLSNVVPAVAIGGTLTADVDVSAATPGGNYNVTLTFTNNDSQTSNCTILVGIATLTPIHDIQGSGASSNPGAYIVEAIVVGDYQVSTQLDGFFIQEEDADADADPTTSEGIFVYCDTCPTDVNVGDLVQVSGSASEFNAMSQITATSAGSVVFMSSGNPLPTPATIDLPIVAPDVNAFYEQYEGMLVNFVDTLTVAEYFELPRFGQLVLNEGGRIHTYTDVDTTLTPAEYTAYLDNIARRTIILDDLDSTQNSPLPAGVVYHPQPGGFSITNYVRGGYTIGNMTGVLHWSWAGFGAEEWRIRPVYPEYNYSFTPSNPRPTTPTPPVFTNLTVASFNVLNYFTTTNGRGADSAAEFQRQSDKIVSAICAMDADVIGLMEIQNNGDTAVADLVAKLDVACPDYDFIATGAVGTDEIKVAIIYRPGVVTPFHPYEILDSSVDPLFDSSRNRPAIAQTFRLNSNLGLFTVVVNHLKSKGSSCGVGDDDLTTGQGNCNLTRTNAATALVNWLASDPTGSDDDDFIIIGDLNSYRNEDPIVALESGGYIDLIDTLLGANAYGYVFDGQLGYLDHALATSALASQVLAVDHWHINADEASLLDYNNELVEGDEASFEAKPSGNPLYEPNQFRSSDHDPVVLWLDLDPPIVDLALTKNDNGASGVPGSTINYTLSYINNGNIDLTGVTITETVPAGTVFNAGASTVGWSCVPDNSAGSTCTFAVGTVIDGANGSTTFAVDILSPFGATSPITNTAVISDDGSNGTDITPADNTAIETTAVLVTPTPTPVTPTPITPTLTPTPITPTLTPSNTPCVLIATAPTLLSPQHRTHTTDTTPAFGWTNVPNAKSYRLMVYTEDRSFEYKKRVFTRTYTLTAAEALTVGKYLWRVRTQDFTCSTWSKWSTRNTLFID